QPFLCRDGARVVGRCAAILNPRLCDGGIPLGQVGYFESIDDTGVARQLFEACFAWLRKQGARDVVGPMNGGAQQYHRLLVRGFEKEPFPFEPRNPSYYSRLFEACGFRRVRVWDTFDISRAELEIVIQRCTPAARQAASRYHLFRPDLRDPG